MAKRRAKAAKDIKDNAVLAEATVWAAGVAGPEGWAWLGWAWLRAGLEGRELDRGVPRGSAARSTLALAQAKKLQNFC